MKNLTVIYEYMGKIHSPLIVEAGGAYRFKGLTHQLVIQVRSPSLIPSVRSTDVRVASVPWKRCGI
jgi:hypothetical protein